MIRVLVIDDSPTIRAMIKVALRKDPEINIVGEAGDPYEARLAIKELLPDVVTLDVEMPKMSGTDFLEKIMRLRPMPVIMFSTLTYKGARTSIEALSLGAFDCIGKPEGGDMTDALSSLAEKVKLAAKSNIGKHTGHRKNAAPLASNFMPNGKVVAIGASTGGVEALTQVLSSFPKNCPATAIVQHMPPLFTKSFAERLNKQCAPNVYEAENGMPFEEGNIYLAPGGDHHLTVDSRSGRAVCRVLPGPPVSSHSPSVDELFGSFARTFGPSVVGALLTGMGSDGARGLLTIRQSGGLTIGQDEDSSIVYGMPRVAFEMGAVQRQLDLSDIGPMILGACSRNEEKEVLQSAS